MLEGVLKVVALLGTAAGLFWAAWAAFRGRLATERRRGAQEGAQAQQQATESATAEAMAQADADAAQARVEAKAAAERLAAARAAEALGEPTDADLAELSRRSRGGS